MIYRILSTLALLAALAGAYILSEDASEQAAPVSVQASPDDAAMKSLRID